MRLHLPILVLTLHAAAQTWQAGDLSLALDAQSRMTVRWGETTVVNYDQLQLVDPTPEWRVLADLGRATPGVLACTRENRRDGQAGWRLAWEFPAGTGATRCYYFLDIPAALVDGAACEFETMAGKARGVLPGDCAAMVGLRSIRIHGKDLRLDFDLGGQGVSWQMTDWSNTQHRSYRLRIESPAEAGGKAAATVALRVAPSSPAAVAALRAEWAKAEQDERERIMVAQGFRSARPLAVGQPQAPATVRRGQPFALAVPLAATFDNPFDFEDVALDAEFVRPDGTIDLVPGYFDLPARRTAEGAFAGLGEPVWRVRYTPLLPGTYRYRAMARDRSGTAESAPGEFVCADAPFRGFVRAGRERPHAFEFADGTAYQPLGFNLFAFARLGGAYPEDRLARLEGYVDRLADARGNFVRLRMDSWWLEIENTADPGLGFLGPGFYNQRVCDEIDRLFALCERRDVQVMLCLYNANGMVNRSVEADGGTAWRRPYAFFLKENGGSCDDRLDFWTDPQARKWIRMRLRYAVARWGGSPSLLCWEFWNELVFDPKVADRQVAWHDEMARFLRAADPWDHPISNSLMTRDLENQDPMWNLPEMDVVQVHSYRGDELPVYLDHLVRTAHGRWAKPFFLGEYGIIHEDRSQGTYPYDPEGVHLHNGIWAPAMAGGAPGAFWFVEGYLDRGDLYGRYRAFAEWSADIPWNRAALRGVEVAGYRHAAPPPLADGPVAGMPGDRYAKAPVSRFVVDPTTGAVSDPQWFQSLLHMGEERKTCPVLVLDCAEQTVLEVRVDVSVGDESNRLVVQVDGGEPLVRPFPAGDGKGSGSTYVEAYGNWRTAYGETVEIPLAPGRREVRLEGIGKDRLEIGLRLRHYFRADPVVVTGQRTDDAAWIWARHRLSTAYNLRAGTTWEAARGTTVLLADFPSGTYDIEWTDSWTGTVERLAAEAADGRLPVPVPAVRRDLAAKIRRR